MDWQAKRLEGSNDMFDRTASEKTLAPEASVNGCKVLKEAKDDLD
jgi:hypothetical protein